MVTCRRRREVSAGWLLGLLLLGLPTPCLGAEPAPPAAPSRRGPELPSATQIVVLVRTTILTLNDAIQTGNFSVMLDKAAASIRTTNNSGSLYKSYSQLVELRPDLSSVAIISPELTRAEIADGGLLRLDGVLPSSPITVKFNLNFTSESGKWRWKGIGLTFLTVPVPAKPAKEKPKSASP